MNEALIAGIATTTVAATVFALPEWFTAKDGIEIGAVLLLGAITTIAREAYYHYDSDFRHPTSFFQTVAMIPVGLVGAILGMELAIISGFPEGDWVFVVAIAWIGGEALDILSNTIMGLIDKALSIIGVKQEQDAKQMLARDVRDEEKRIEKEELQHKKEIEDLRKVLNENL